MAAWQPRPMPTEPPAGTNPVDALDPMVRALARDLGCEVDEESLAQARAYCAEPVIVETRGEQSAEQRRAVRKAVAAEAPRLILHPGPLTRRARGQIAEQLAAGRHDERLAGSAFLSSADDDAGRPDWPQRIATAVSILVLFGGASIGAIVGLVTLATNAGLPILWSTAVALGWVGGLAFWVGRLIGGRR